MKKAVVIAGLLIALGVFGSRSWYTAALQPVDPADQTRVTFTVESGQGVSSIADSLKAEGLIRSARAFTKYVKENDLDTKLQAGRFVLKPSLSVAELAAAMTDGRTEEIILTIPEGYTVLDIDALLESEGLAEAGAFLNCAQECDLSAYGFLPSAYGLADRGGRVEGYLYPDTYFVVAESFSAEAFIKRLLDTFDDRVVQGLSDDIAASGRSLHEIVTMASLVEEEAGAPEERPVIAGILWKRLDNGIGLGVDATVRYLLDKPSAAITRADLDTDDPYNTRKFRDLPPGPIANSGYDSITATLEPTETAYLYYLHGTDGQIRYAATNDEHNANRDRYLR